MKQFLLVLGGFLVFFTTLYFWSSGKSGGDIGFVGFTAIFLVVYTLFLGMITYSRDLKDKVGVIIGLLVSYLIAYLIIQFIL